MEGARIVIFEDDHEVREMLVRLLVRAGHSVVACAGTPEEAKETIDALNPGEVDVATVDNNLTSGDLSNNDGAEITERIHEKFGRSVVVIGLSGSGDVQGADIQVGKNKPPRALKEAIAGI